MSWAEEAKLGKHGILRVRLKNLTKRRERR